MDENLSRAVREAFVRLYDDGLIYRGNRIVNWCPNDQTVLSDLEVLREPQKASFTIFAIHSRTAAVQLS